MMVGFEERVASLKQQMYHLHITKTKGEIKEVGKKPTPTLIHGDEEDALELSIAYRNFDDTQSKLQDAQREAQEAIYNAEIAKIKLEAAELDNINAPAKLELSKRLKSLASPRGWCLQHVSLCLLKSGNRIHRRGIREEHGKVYGKDRRMFDKEQEVTE